MLFLFYHHSPCQIFFVTLSMSRWIMKLSDAAIRILPARHSAMSSRVFPSANINEFKISLAQQQEMINHGGWFNLKSRTSIPYPNEEALIFDTENMVLESRYSCLASAIGQNGVYIWISPDLRDTNRVKYDQLIPIKSKLLIAHNLSFDLRKTTLAHNYKTGLYCTLASSQHLYPAHFRHNLQFLSKNQCNIELDKDISKFFVSDKSSNFRNRSEELFKYSILDSIALSAVYNHIQSKISHRWTTERQNVHNALMQMRLVAGFDSVTKCHEEDIFTGQVFKVKPELKPTFRHSFSTTIVPSEKMKYHVSVPVGYKLLYFNKIKANEIFVNSHFKMFFTSLSDCSPSKATNANFINSLMQMLFYDYWNTKSSLTRIALVSNDGIQLYVPESVYTKADFAESKNIPIEFMAAIANVKD